MLSIESPFPQFFDLDGSPLDAGNVYIGIAGDNPQTVPQPVFWDADGFVQADQPLRTLNGYIARNGTPAIVYVPGQYSISIQNRNGITIAYVATQGIGGVDLSAGYSQAKVFLYQRAAVAPALPSAPITYNFITGAVAGLTNGWTTAIPSGTGVMWVTAASAISQDTSDTIAAAEWSEPVVFVQDGLNSATVMLFLRNDSATDPALPAVTTTYTFASGLLSAPGGGWQQSAPTGIGKYLWMTSGTAVSSLATDTIAPAGWAAPKLMAQDGIPGAQGDPGAQGAQGAQGVPGSPGAPGSNGQRGSVQTSAVTTGSAWSDSEANAAIAALGIGGPFMLDRVILYRTDGTFTQERFYNGSAWLAYSAKVDGNLLVTGTVGANALAALTINVGKYIQSANYVVGTSGWRLADTSAQLPSTSIIGQLTFGQLASNAVSKTGTATSVPIQYYTGAAVATPPAGSVDSGLSYTARGGKMQVLVAGSFSVSANAVAGTDGHIVEGSTSIDVFANGTLFASVQSSYARTPVTNALVAGTHAGTFSSNLVLDPGPSAGAVVTVGMTPTVTSRRQYDNTTVARISTAYIGWDVRCIELSS